MKIIFLDVDDVLNNIISGYGGHLPHAYRGFSSFTKENILWDELAVARLKCIIDATDAQIVLSSTWRNIFDMTEFGWIFDLYGLDKERIIGKTGRGRYLSENSPLRGARVKEWFEDHPDENRETTGYVILDDGSDFYEWQNLVQTEVYVGLIESHVQEAINMLNGPYQITLGVGLGDKEIKNKYPWENGIIVYDKERIKKLQGRLSKE